MIIYLWHLNKTELGSEYTFSSTHQADNFIKHVQSQSPLWDISIFSPLCPHTDIFGPFLQHFFRSMIYLDRFAWTTCFRSCSKISVSTRSSDNLFITKAQGRFLHAGGRGGKKKKKKKKKCEMIDLKTLNRPLKTTRLYPIHSYIVWWWAGGN